MRPGNLPSPALSPDTLPLDAAGIPHCAASPFADSVILWKGLWSNGSLESEAGSTVKGRVPSTIAGFSVVRVRGLDVSAHSRNFFDCIRSREKTAANPDVMRRSHIACHAAATAWVLQRKLKFDPVKEEFLGDDEANLLRSRASRNWVV